MWPNPKFPYVISCDVPIVGGIYNIVDGMILQ